MFFILDTDRRLGFTHILSQIEPKSPQGRKVKKAIKPFLPGQEKEFDLMSQRLTFWLNLAKKTDLLPKIQPLLAELRNVEGILERLADGDMMDEGECFEIKANLAITRKIYAILHEIIQANLMDLPSSKEKMTIDKLFDYLGEKESEPIFHLATLDGLWKILNPGSVESDRFYLSDEYDPELAKVRQEINMMQREIKGLLKEELTKWELLLGRQIPASGEVMVSKSDEKALQALQNEPNWRLERETFTTCFYRYVASTAVKAGEEKLDYLEEKEELEAKRVLALLTQKIYTYLSGLIQNQESLGELDWMLAKMEHALAKNCLPPTRFGEDVLKASSDDLAEELVREMTDESINSMSIVTMRKILKHKVRNMIQIKAGRHLPVEEEVLERGSRYTAIDVTVSNGVTVITGSNMGGKTLTLRMLGLLTAMAQHGLCVPAAKMRFSLRSFIYFSVDDDQTKGDLSTFGQEIVGLNHALPRRDERGLYLIDELARGTNPQEGSALGRAVIKFLLECPSITVLTSHFGALTQVEGVWHLQVIGLNQVKYDFKDKSQPLISLQKINQLMDYRLVRVGSGASITRDAIRIAGLLGLDEEIIEEAENELNSLQVYGEM